MGLEGHAHGRDDGDNLGKDDCNHRGGRVVALDKDGGHRHRADEGEAHGNSRQQRHRLSEARHHLSGILQRIVNGACTLHSPSHTLGSSSK